MDTKCVHRLKRQLVITIMAEKELFLSKFSVPAYRGSEVKQVKKGRQYLKKKMKKFLDKSSNHTRVNIGVGFQWWRQLRDLKGLKSDSMA